MTDLDSCIEECYVLHKDGIERFYFDSRFGTEIDDDDLHNDYKSGITNKVQAIKRVISSFRLDDKFHLSVELTDGEIRQADIKYYDMDNTFSSGEYDPRIVIPYLLNCEEHRDFYLSRHPAPHPYFDENFTVDYSVKIPNNMVLHQEHPPPVRMMPSARFFTQMQNELVYEPSDEENEPDSNDAIESAISAINNNEEEDTVDIYFDQDEDEEGKLTDAKIERQLNKLHSMDLSRREESPFHRRFMRNRNRHRRNPTPEPLEIDWEIPEHSARANNLEYHILKVLTKTVVEYEQEKKTVIDIVSYSHETNLLRDVSNVYVHRMLAGGLSYTACFLTPSSKPFILNIS